MYICGEKTDINMIRNTLLALALGTALCGQAQESMKAEFLFSLRLSVAAKCEFW